MKRVLMVATLLAAIGVAGCTTQNQVLLPPPGTVAKPVLTHMYVSLATPTTGSVQIYSTPITSVSTPTGTITGLNEPEEIFVDGAGRLFVPLYAINAGTHVQVYTPPISGASTPAFTLTTLHTAPESATEDSSGNVYVGVLSSNTCCIDVFSGPVNTSVSASFEVTANGVVSHGLGYPYGMGFDSTGNLYVSSTTSIIKLAPPITSGSTPAANVTPNQDNFGLVVDSSNNVYVADATVDGTMDVFTQPFTNSSTRSFGILVTSSSNYLTGTALDGSGNLWTVDSNGNIWEIVAPITASSTATKILTVPNAYGIAFGP